MWISELETESLIGPRPPFAANLGRLHATQSRGSALQQAGDAPVGNAYVSLLEIGPDTCKQVLERVVNSRELKRALRLRELLCYIGQRSLKPQPGILREQEIGAAVFGRPKEYDTNLDNIVRVNVSELRKRLAHYFQEEGANEPMTIEIARGGYVPVFLPRVLEHEAKAPEATQTSQHSELTLDATGSIAGSDVHSAALPPVARDKDTMDGAPGSLRLEARSSQTRVVVSSLVFALSTVLLLAAAGLVWLAWQNHHLLAQTQPWKSDPVVASLWSEFFGSNQDVDIVTADSSFALAEDLVGHTISLEDYLDYKYKDVIDQPGLTPETRSALRLVLDRNNGSIGDFHAAERFRDLSAQSPSVKLESARSYTTENIKTNNVVLLGARQSNPWVDLYKDKMNFFTECEPGRQRSYVVNRNPAAGEQTIYESPDRSHGFSVVAFLPNLAEHRYALIVSGTDSQATRAAGEFVTSSEGLAQIRARMPNGRFPYFEVVLSSSRLVGTTLDTKMVAYRVRQR